jgi:hypothetical protein
MHSEHRRRTAGRLATAVALAVAAMGIGMASAQADTAPPGTCGVTQPGPCTETDHFTQATGLQWPLGTPTNATNCPAWLLNDWAVFDFTGNGVQHVSVDKAQDFWFTTTFTGNGTVTIYPPSSIADIVMDDHGNIVSYDVVGPADDVITGQLTQWFGASDNNRNAVNTGTVNVQGTDTAGKSFSLHGTFHAGWTGTQNPMTDPPHKAFQDITC